MMIIISYLHSLWKRLIHSNVFLTLFLLILGLYLLFWHNPVEEPPQTIVHQIKGRAKITDGDSIIIQQSKIRLLGIDAPELKQTCKKEKKTVPCGLYAKNHLIRMINNQIVTCFWDKKDMHKRILGHCFAGETDLNLMMILDGWAFSYENDYRQEQKEARQNKRGMWQWRVQNPRKWRKKNPLSSQRMIQKEQTGKQEKDALKTIFTK